VTGNKKIADYKAQLFFWLRRKSCVFGNYKVSSGFRIVPDCKKSGNAFFTNHHEKNLQSHDTAKNSPMKIVADSIFQVLCILKLR